MCCSTADCRSTFVTEYCTFREKNSRHFLCTLDDANNSLRIALSNIFVSKLQKNKANFSSFVCPISESSPFSCSFKFTTDQRSNLMVRGSDFPPFISPNSFYEYSIWTKKYFQYPPSNFQLPEWIFPCLINFWKLKKFNQSPKIRKQENDFIPY